MVGRPSGASLHGWAEQHGPMVGNGRTQWHSSLTQLGQADILNFSMIPARAFPQGPQRSIRGQFLGRSRYMKRNSSHTNYEKEKKEEGDMQAACWDLGPHGLPPSADAFRLLRDHHGGREHSLGNIEHKTQWVLNT